MLESVMESAFPCAMTRAAETLPNDVDALRALLVGVRKAHDAQPAILNVIGSYSLARWAAAQTHSEGHPPNRPLVI